MALRIRIDHHTKYVYEKPVGFSPHFVRLFPRTEPGRLVQKVTFHTNPEASVQYRRDLFDNSFARCFYPDKGTDLIFDLTIEIDLEEYNAFGFLLENFAVNYPFPYRPEELARLSPYIGAAGLLSGQQNKLLPLPFWKLPAEPVSTVSLLSDLVDVLHKNIAYERREEGTARPPAETVQLGRGACRDTAVLFTAVLGELGFAARSVSGYLCEFTKASKERRADGAMHLWTEVYLPGAGWTGLDPTNGVFCDHSYIATAVGLTTAEITPISGSYFGKEIVPQTMTATLEITTLKKQTTLRKSLKPKQ